MYNKICKICRSPFEHHLKNAKYCSPECRAEARRRQSEYQKAHKRCTWCGEMRNKKTEFPTGRMTNSTGLQLMSVCIYCMPFTVEIVNTVPKCGTVIDKRGNLTFVPSCPLYDNCRERMHYMMDPPCMVPDRRSLTVYYRMGEKEKARVKKLYTVRLTEKGEVVPDSIDRYLEFYIELGKRMEREYG